MSEEDEATYPCGEAIKHVERVLTASQNGWLHSVYVRDRNGRGHGPYIVILFGLLKRYILAHVHGIFRSNAVGHLVRWE
ncbi:hypothetical protein PsYK624_154610 [Phanerochaete sordida]|uniref:Uncharacterized protein n=1 Tax=Phanerochaete sordida TaxID=48140 RepID=A0A9P3GP99_9APHY|nr:hypothetical protein PsYK624_154610 [Phanerochaete sordida]